MQFLKTLDGFWTKDDLRLSPELLEERIGVLRDVRSEREDDGQGLSSSEEAELRELLSFRSVVGQLVIEGFDSAILVPDEAFLRYAQHWARENHGIEEGGLAGHIDWAGYIQAKQQADYFAADLGEHRVWVCVTAGR